jgi:hypothetical protein
LFGGAAVSLVIQTPGLNLPAAEFLVGLSEESSRVARAHSSPGREWVTAVGKDLGKSFIRLSDHMDLSEFITSAYAEDFLDVQGLAHEGPILHVTSPEEAILSSGLVIYRRNEGPEITDAMLGEADRLVPHLHRAIMIHGELLNTQQQQVALHEVIDRIPTGVIILDTQRRPLITNRMAQRIATDADGFSAPTLSWSPRFWGARK